MCKCVKAYKRTVVVVDAGTEEAASVVVVPGEVSSGAASVVVVPVEVSSGGSGGGALSTVPANETGIALRQLFLEDVLQRKIVTRPKLGRIVQLP